MMKRIRKTNPRVFPSSSKPYGRTMEQWVEYWIKWALSIPTKDNPAADESGKHCAQNQEGPAWFLAGTFGGVARRKCTIPVRKGILFPIIAKECSFVEDEDLKTEVELIGRVKEAMNLVLKDKMQAYLDGEKVQNLQNYRKRSRVFNLTFPPDNVYGVRAGTTRSVADGFWLFLKPLPVGKHEIHFSGELSYTTGSKLAELAVRYNKIAGTFFKTEVTYALTVTG
jgi:hypothetical protein